jgi:hypothetical protein
VSHRHAATDDLPQALTESAAGGAQPRAPHHQVEQRDTRAAGGLHRRARRNRGNTESHGADHRDRRVAAPRNSARNVRVRASLQTCIAGRS